MRPAVRLLAVLACLAAAAPAHGADGPRARARALGYAPGILPTGRDNAITDVAGVKVGQVTRIEGADVRTGVTAILPHGGNLYQDKVPAAVSVENAYGKLMGSTQVAELGEIETPIVLTNTLSVAQAADGVVAWTLAQPGNERVGSVNAVVGETNDGTLNNIRKRVVTREDVLNAINSAKAGPVEEGAVGAGTGTMAFDWKGGIGTSSRVLPAALGGYTVGVLVQSNFGGSLTVMGDPVGVRLGRYYLQQYAPKGPDKPAVADGSIMIVVATDAPLSDRNLQRLAKRAFAGLARTGSAFTNGSGDYAIAFSTAQSVRRTPQRRALAPAAIEDLPNEAMSPLFVAAADATEEAIYDSLFMARTIDSTSRDGKPVRGEALDLTTLRNGPRQAACPASSPAAVADTVREMFAGLAADDGARLARVLTPDFYAYDAGRRFDGPGLAALVKAAHAAGKRLVWTVDEPDVRIACDRAWIAYVNRGSVADAAGTQPVTWQESATLRFADGRWRIEFLHSNRAAATP